MGKQARHVGWSTDANASSNPSGYAGNLFDMNEPPLVINIVFIEKIGEVRILFKIKPSSLKNNYPLNQVFSRRIY
jgi:hypothetical protein